MERQVGGPKVLSDTAGILRKEPTRPLGADAGRRGLGGAGLGPGRLRSHLVLSARRVLARDGSGKLDLGTDICSHRVLRCGCHSEVLKDIVVSVSGLPYGRRDLAEVIKDLEVRSYPRLSGWTLDVRGTRRDMRQRGRGDVTRGQRVE